MAAFSSGSRGFQSREGLNSRQHLAANPDQISINIQPGYDFDRDIEGLSSQVGRLKQVSRAINQEAELSRQEAASLEEILENAKVAMKRLLLDCSCWLFCKLLYIALVVASPSSKVIKPVALSGLPRCWWLLTYCTSAGAPPCWLFDSQTAAALEQLVAEGPQAHQLHT
ncbi:hypothetical protein WJX74_007709 [Apatococcus lobatus]|uniref:t-SNARE coiled-coil homology domain-containing protein n=1 Tax=Apatococcus lobatus TaxID=904363 RepID=A0AAW1SC00_9CHLO